MRFLKIAQQMRRTRLRAFEDVVKHLQDMGSVDEFLDIPVVVVPKELWDKFELIGYGFMLDDKDFAPNRRQLERAMQNPALYWSLPTPEHRQEVNLYKIFQKVGEPKLAVVLDSPAADYFLVHEFSHLAALENPDAMRHEQMDFGDEYLDQRDEQFAHMQEMVFAKKKGVTFDQWFETTWPNTKKIIDEKRDKRLYELALMDYRDYQKLWEKTDDNY